MIMEIKSFKAYRFNPEIVDDVGNCIAPPYDVINPEQQRQLYEKGEFNIVRIIKGKTEPADNESSNQYTRAADYLNSWIKKGALKQDSDESIYSYVQDFEFAGKDFQRFSFIALAKLEEFGRNIRPHEQILKKPIIDRLSLKRATKAKFGLVFMLYEDKKNIADKIIKKNISDNPLLDFIDEQHVRHRLFAVTSKNDIGQIRQMMQDKTCIIADGHHRYTTGLMYSKENTSPLAQYQMTAFGNTCHKGLLVLATHRLAANIKNFDFAKLLDAMKDNFEITKYSFDSQTGKSQARKKMLSQMKQEHDSSRNAFGIYSDKDSFFVAVLKDIKKMDAAVENMSQAWKCLDVSVLHKLILEKLLGVDEEKLAQENCLEYVKDTLTAIDESITKVDSKQAQVVFFMNPPKTSQIQMVAEEGEKMPQKSTYFFPKMWTGLTINKL